VLHPGLLRSTAKLISSIEYCKIKESIVTMAPRQGVDDERPHKKRKVQTTTEADVQVKVELGGGPVSKTTGFQQPPASQPLASKPPASQPSDSQSASLQPVIDWFVEYKSCQSYFLNYAQHSAYVQALCAFMNIKLPYQKIPIFPQSAPFPWLPHGRSPWPPPPDNLRLPLLGNLSFPPPGNESSQYVSLIPYIQRLVCMGLDDNLNLQKFFGRGWSSGIGTIHENERKNYLKAAKRSWLEVKLAYDIGSEDDDDDDDDYYFRPVGPPEGYKDVLS
jgi:hypothetical protein